MLTGMSSRWRASGLHRDSDRDALTRPSPVACAERVGHISDGVLSRGFAALTSPALPIDRPLLGGIDSQV